MQGRFHLYQGVTPREAVRPLRALIYLGAKYFIVTNAAGGINPSFKPGDLMLIRDDLNLTFANPLVGPNLEEFGEQFFDMSSTYDPVLRELTKGVASRLKIDLKEGTYAANLGPNYERPYEIQVLKGWGVDAVGMSTVPEVLAARHASKKYDVRILGISLITNLAAGISKTPLSHEEVQETGRLAAEKFQRLVSEIVKELS